ncbi:MAG TPA: hypothetical protein VHI99_02275 [Vicinamibacterales bacterium]|jgi:hypothetical protein|nr:hypothetical protein [Vicinamibacterales bacterium]
MIYITSTDAGKGYGMEAGMSETPGKTAASAGIARRPSEHLSRVGLRDGRAPGV